MLLLICRSLPPRGPKGPSCLMPPGWLALSKGRLSCSGAGINQADGARDKVPIDTLSCINVFTYFFLADGWRYEKSYRFLITHLPECGIIRLKLYEGAKQLHDSGDIVDNGPESLRGGRLGVYCDSQENIMWSALSYKCISAKDCNATTTAKP